MRSRFTAALLLALAALFGQSSISPANASLPATTAGSYTDVYTCGDGISPDTCGPIAFLNGQPTVGTAQVKAVATHYSDGANDPYILDLKSLNGHRKTWRLYCQNFDGTTTAARFALTGTHFIQADLGNNDSCGAHYRGFVLAIGDTWNGCGPYETDVWVPAKGFAWNTIGGQPERTSAC